MKRLLRGSFGEGAARTASDGPPDAPRIQTGRIEFVFALVRAETPEQLSRRLGLVATMSTDHDGVVHDILGPLLVTAFGTLASARPSPTSRTNLVMQLRERLKGNIKIIRVAADGHFGLFGDDTRLSFTFTFPRFDAALAALGRVEWGHAEEFKE